MINWSPHAQLRAAERDMPASFAENVRALVHLKKWRVFYEVDERYGRGLRENLVVAAPGGYAVLRLNEGVYTVVSVLTEEQYRFNVAVLWSYTPGQACEKAKKERSTLPLRQTPFEALKRKLRGPATGRG